LPLAEYPETAEGPEKVFLTPSSLFFAHLSMVKYESVEYYPDRYCQQIIPCEKAVEYTR
jgi:hypothetical protein